VTLSLVKPKWTAPVERERTEKILKMVLAAARSVNGVDVGSVDGQLGKTMTIKMRNGAVKGAGAQKGDVKLVTVTLPVSEAKLEPKLVEIKATLRKGTDVKICLEEDMENGKSKSGLNGDEIWKLILTTVRSVKGAVELPDNKTDTQPKRFTTNYSKDDLPRIIEIESHLGSKMLEVRAQWVASWLQKRWPVRLYVHDGQNSAEKITGLIKIVEDALHNAVNTTKEESSDISGAIWYTIVPSERPMYKAPQQSQSSRPLEESTYRQPTRQQRHQDASHRRIQFSQTRNGISPHDKLHNLLHSIGGH
jgi:hypothetical protein